MLVLDLLGFCADETADLPAIILFRLCDGEDSLEDDEHENEDDDFSTSEFRLKSSKASKQGSESARLLGWALRERVSLDFFYSERKQNESAILKLWRQDPFVISITRNATANPRSGFGPSSELMEQTATVD